MPESVDYIFTLNDLEIKDLAISLHKRLASKHVDMQLALCAMDEKLKAMHKAKLINKAVFDTLIAMLYKAWKVNNNMGV